MQVSVQKSTTTACPRSRAGPSGSVLSHPLAPSKAGAWTRAKPATDAAPLPAPLGRRRVPGPPAAWLPVAGPKLATPPTGVGGVTEGSTLQRRSAAQLIDSSIAPIA